MTTHFPRTASRIAVSFRHVVDYGNEANRRRQSSGSSQRAPVPERMPAVTIAAPRCPTGVLQHAPSKGWLQNSKVLETRQLRATILDETECVLGMSSPQPRANPKSGRCSWCANFTSPHDFVHGPASGFLDSRRRASRRAPPPRCFRLVAAGARAACPPGGHLVPPPSGPMFSRHQDGRRETDRAHTHLPSCNPPTDQSNGPLVIERHSHLRLP